MSKGRIPAGISPPGAKAQRCSTDGGVVPGGWAALLRGHPKPPESQVDSNQTGKGGQRQEHHKLPKALIKDNPVKTCPFNYSITALKG